MFVNFAINLEHAEAGMGDFSVIAHAAHRACCTLSNRRHPGIPGA
jgi:hypothetical protein